MNGFDLFWETYPHKVSKGQAVKAWEKLNPDETLAKQIILALSAQKKYRVEAKSTGEFVPPWKYPATWLNGQCWLDEIPSHGALREKQNAQIESCKCGRKATQQGGLCARCWSDKYAAQGPTGEDVLRRAWKSTPPRLPGESGRDHFIRIHGDPKKYGLGTDKGKSPGTADIGEGSFEYGPEDGWNRG